MPCPYYRATTCEGTTKRYRITNTSIYAKITLTIDQHDMGVNEADGISLDGKNMLLCSLLSSLPFNNFIQLKSSSITNIETDEIIDAIINNIYYRSHLLHLHGVWV
ncbi:unnamed protein product, partial [Rotaria sp. Silwood2]